MKKRELTTVFVTMLFLTSATSILIPMIFADSISGPGGPEPNPGTAPYYYDGSYGLLDPSDGYEWALMVTDIDASSITGNKVFHFVVQDAGSGWESIYIQVHYDFYGSGGHLFQSGEFHSGTGWSWVVRSSHGFNPGDVPGTADLRLLIQDMGSYFRVTPQFRLPLGPWTTFWDGAWDTLDFELTTTRLVMQIDGGGDGTLTFDEPLAYSNGIWYAGPPGTIQAAIDAADPSDTVMVFPGTYFEGDISVDKQLTLQGAGSASTIIDASVGTLGVLLSAGGISASQRLTIKGFTIKNSWQGIRAYKAGGLNLEYVTFEDLVLTLNAHTGMEIHNDVIVHDMEITSCEFVDNGNVGLRTASNVIVDGLVITDSKINGNSWGIYLQGTINDVTILRSEFNDNTNYGGYMTETGPLTNLVIEDCEFKNNVVGLMVWNVQDNEDITITKTLFEDNDKWGVLIWGATLTDVLIEECTVLNNDGLSAGYYGIDFNTYNEIMTNVAVHYTSITGHTIGGGVNNRNTVSTAIVDATLNWWGDASGPYHSTSWTYDSTTIGPNPGSGDGVTDYVLYDPWLSVPADVYWILEDLKYEINELLDSDFKDPSTAGEKKASLNNKIDVVINLVNLGKLNQAIKKLEKDIGPKLDTGYPQCWLSVAHPELIDKINDVIDLLSP